MILYQDRFRCEFLVYGLQIWSEYAKARWHEGACARGEPHRGLAATFNIGKEKKKKTYRIFFGHCRLRKILFTRRHSQHSICLIISFYSGRIVSIASDKIAMWKSSIRNLQACQRRRNNRSTVSRHTIHSMGKSVSRDL